MAPRRHNETHKTFDALEKKTMEFITIKCIFSQKKETHIQAYKIIIKSENDVFLRFNID